MKTAVRILAAAVMVFVPAACSGPSEDLSSARSRWASLHIDTYVITVRRSCFCGGPLNFQIHVQGGTITEMFDPDTGSPLPVPLSAPYYDVAGLFAVVESAIARKPHKIEVTYNAAYGYPEHVSIDPEQMAADDEDAYGVTAFSTGN